MVFLLEYVGGGGKSSGWGKSVFSECLRNQPVAYVQHFASCVFVCAVDAIGPHVCVVSGHDCCRIIVPEP